MPWRPIRAAAGAGAIPDAGGLRPAGLCLFPGAAAGGLDRHPCVWRKSGHRTGPVQHRLVPRWNSMMERFSHLRRKEVINICDGRRLGFVGGFGAEGPGGGRSRPSSCSAPAAFSACSAGGRISTSHGTACSGSGTISSSSTSPSSGGRRIKAPPLGLNRDNTAKKAADFPGETQKISCKQP